jgi:hypothetical protein
MEGPIYESRFSRGVDFNISKEEVERRIYKAFPEFRDKFDKIKQAMGNKRNIEIEESDYYDDDYYEDDLYESRFSRGVDFNISREEVRRRIYKAFPELRSKLNQIINKRGRKEEDIKESFNSDDYKNRSIRSIRDEINNMSEIKLSQLILGNPSMIKWINNPSIKLQKLAVNVDPHSIEYIQDPSQELIEIIKERDPMLFNRLKTKYGWKDYGYNSRSVKEIDKTIKDDKKARLAHQLTHSAYHKQKGDILSNKELKDRIERVNKLVYEDDDD